VTQLSSFRKSRWLALLDCVKRGVNHTKPPYSFIIGSSLDHLTLYQAPRSPLCRRQSGSGFLSFDILEGPKIRTRLSLSDVALAVSFLLLFLPSTSTDELTRVSTGPYLYDMTNENTTHRDDHLKMVTIWKSTIELDLGAPSDYLTNGFSASDIYIEERDRSRMKPTVWSSKVKRGRKLWGTDV